MIKEFKLDRSEQNPMHYIRDSCSGEWPEKEHDFYPSGWFLSADMQSIRVRYVGGESGLILPKIYWLANKDK